MTSCAKRSVMVMKDLGHLLLSRSMDPENAFLCQAVGYGDEGPGTFAFEPLHGSRE